MSKQAPDNTGPVLSHDIPRSAVDWSNNYAVHGTQPV